MAVAADTSPVHRRRLVVTDVDEATDLLRREYVAHRPTFSGDRAAFRLRVASTAVDSDLGPFRVDRVRHNLPTTATVEPAPSLMLVTPRSGRLRHAAGDDEGSSTCLVPYWMPSVVDWDELDATVALLDLDGVRRVAAEIAGVDAAAVDVTGCRPTTPAMERYVVSVLDHLSRTVLPEDGVAANPLVRGNAFRQLATAVLAAFPNTTHTTLPAAAPDLAEPATVRRAVEFMEAHVQQDIDITRIAEAARIGTRGLQAAFRKHRGQAPLEYLRGIRLDGAHRDLQAGDPTQGDTVAGIAAGWGFTHPGRFSVEYRRAYGRSPSETLRR